MNCSQSDDPRAQIEIEQKPFIVIVQVQKMPEPNGSQCSCSFLLSFFFFFFYKDGKNGDCFTSLTPACQHCYCEPVGITDVGVKPEESLGLSTERSCQSREPGWRLWLHNVADYV